MPYHRFDWHAKDWPWISPREISSKNYYRKFPNRGAGRLGKTLGGAIIREGTFSSSSGFLQNENRTISGWDVAKNV